jgi:LysM repeat protein
MRKIAFFTVALCLSFYSFAQNIYIRYDESCTDKLEYRFVADANAVQYNTYRVKNNIGDNIYLETGVESPLIQKKAPAQMIDCQNITFDRSVLSAINKGQRKAYMVKQLDSGWALFAIGSASSMAFRNNTITYLSPKYELQADLGTHSGESVSLRYPSEESVSTIFYLGELSACNSKAYMFKMTPSHICNVDADITIHPQLGLVREKLLDSDMFELVSINDIFVCDYLSPNPVAMASSEPIVTTESTQPSWSNDAQNTEGVSVSSEPTSFIPTEEVGTKNVVETPKLDCGVAAKDGEHVVQQGESLYGIARLYGLSVNALRSWNDVSADVIYPCSTLKVVAPPQAQQPSMAEARTNDVPMAYAKKAIAKKKDFESDYEIVVTAKAIKKSKINCTNVAKEGEHIVQQGENLNGVAKQYNLSVAQLKTWNGLTNDIIHPCDKLNIVETDMPMVTPKKVVPKAVKTNVAPKSTAKKADVPKTYATIVKPKEAKKATAKATPKSPATTAVASTEKALMVKKGSGLYVVKKGETVATLAKRYKLVEKEFRSMNNLGTSEIIYAGQVVKTQNCACVVEEELPQTYSNVVVSSKKVRTDIPTSYDMPQPIKVKENTEGVTVTSKSGAGEDKRRKYHVVQSTETLFTISKMYGTTVERLKTSNGISEGEVIVPNQLLVLE